MAEIGTLSISYELASSVLRPFSAMCICHGSTMVMKSPTFSVATGIIYLEGTNLMSNLSEAIGRDDYAEPIRPHTEYVEDVPWNTPFIYHGKRLYTPQQQPSFTRQPKSPVYCKIVKKGNHLNPRGKWVKVPWGSVVELCDVKLTR